MSIQKISDSEVRSLWVQRLADTPNRAGRYGTPGLSAAEMKAAYDALSLRLVEAYNALVDAIESGKLTESIPVLGEKTLAEVLSDIQSGRLASYLSVDGLRTLARLAAEFDTHGHPSYAPLAGSEEQTFSVGEPKDGADALPLAYADGRYLSDLSAAYDPESGRLSLSAARKNSPIEASVQLPTEEKLLEACDRRIERLRASLTNLRESALGVTYETVNATGTGSQHPFEEGTLPNAQIRRLGGYASFLPEGGFWCKAPVGFTVLDAAGNITQNEEDSLAPVKRLFPDFMYGISPALCNYYDLESGLYHRCVRAENYPTPLLGSGSTFSPPVLDKENSAFFVFNVIIGGKKPFIPSKTNTPLLFCSNYFKAVTSADLLYSAESVPLISLYGESSGYRCLKIRVPRENEWGVTADPQTLTAFFADKAMTLILPYEEEILSVKEALLSEGSEETLPDGLIEVVPHGKLRFGSSSFSVCYELEYDRKKEEEA